MKEELTKQSVKLFEKKGFTATSIQDIVNSLSVTKGTFYYYFTSKETLLRDIYFQYMNDLLRRQESILDSEETFRNKLIKVVELLIYDIQTQGANARVYFREMLHLTEENITTITNKRKKFHLNIEQIIIDGKKNKEFRNGLDPKVTAYAILGITSWSYEWFNASGKVSPQELASMYIKFILHGIDSKGA